MDYQHVLFLIEHCYNLLFFVIHLEIKFAFLFSCLRGKLDFSKFPIITLLHSYGISKPNSFSASVLFPKSMMRYSLFLFIHRKGTFGTIDKYSSIVPKVPFSFYYNVTLSSFQISFTYSSIVRSDENLPALLTFISADFAHPVSSLYASSTLF